MAACKLTSLLVCCNACVTRAINVFAEMNSWQAGVRSGLEKRERHTPNTDYTHIPWPCRGNLRWPVLDR